MGFKVRMVSLGLSLEAGEASRHSSPGEGRLCSWISYAEGAVLPGETVQNTADDEYCCLRQSS